MSLALYSPEREPPDGPPTVQSLIDAYLLTHTGAPDAVKETRRILFDLFCPVFGEIPAEALEPNEVRAWMQRQETWRSDWTRLRIVRTIKAPFNQAARDGKIGRNPLASLRHKPGKRGRPTRDAELQTLFRGTTACFRRVLVFLADNGPRPDEMSRIEWKHWIPERGVFELGEHKTDANGLPRTIVLTLCCQKLVMWIRRHSPHPKYVFVNSHGRPWTRGALVKRIDRLRKKFNLPADLKLYGCRHRCITNVLRAGGDLKTASVLAGHASVVTTAQTYAHVEKDTAHLRAALERAKGKRE